MSSIFSQIVTGNIPCHKVAENDQFLAFLDIMPLAIGHTLVIPKVEIDRIWDLEPSLLGNLHVFSQQVALALEEVIPCKRVGQAVIGLEVPHAHVHLIPLQGVSDINFERDKLRLSSEDLASTAALIREAFIKRQASLRE